MFFEERLLLEAEKLMSNIQVGASTLEQIQILAVMRRWLLRMLAAMEGDLHKDELGSVNRIGADDVFDGTCKTHSEDSSNQERGRKTIVQAYSDDETIE